MTHFVNDIRRYKLLTIGIRRTPDKSPIWKAIKEAYDKRKATKKFPTSISLAEDVVSDLKSIASRKGIPYQTLMRMLIIEGLEKLKKAA